MSGLTHMLGDGWPPVSLAAVDERAALLDRQESKYVVPAKLIGPTLDRLHGDFDALTIDDRNVFGYDTVYFDTEDLLAYRQHAGGRRLRFKARSRRYIDSDLCFAEIKLKGRRDRTIKHRIRIPAGDHGMGTAAAADFFSAAVVDTYGPKHVPTLVPTLRMRFDRVTLVGTSGPERVTIDHGLRFVTPTGQRAAATDDLVIVEVKSVNGHGAADRVFRATGRRGERCSKYCIGLNLVRPGLRNNAFKRSIGRFAAGSAMS